jgi:hypothetical protein
MTSAVDEFIASTIPESQYPLVERVRAVMRDCAPDAAEVISYKMLCWSQGRIIAYLTATEKHVLLGFIHGTTMHDAHKLLKGRGKSTRHIRLTHIDDVPPVAICDYVAQELALAAE